MRGADGPRQAAQLAPTGRHRQTVAHWRGTAPQGLADRRCPEEGGMMREIVLDTETTGLDPASGHRIVEIAALELLHHVPSGRTFREYLTPERDVPPEAERIHGLSAEFLKDQPLFTATAPAFLDLVAARPTITPNKPSRQ